jgi:hypothetical protein
LATSAVRSAFSAYSATACDLLGGALRVGRHPRLALGASRYLADRQSDLTSRLARLLRGTGHLLGRGCDRASRRGDVADQAAQPLGALVVSGIAGDKRVAEHLRVALDLTQLIAREIRC